MRPKLTDVAKKAGVSKTTVSRVINNKPGVAAEKRKKIQKLLEESHQEQVDLRHYGFPKNWMDLLAIKI